MKMNNKAKIKTRKQRREEERKLYWEKAIEEQRKKAAETAVKKKQQENGKKSQGQVTISPHNVEGDIKRKKKEEKGRNETTEITEDEETEEIMSYFINNLKEPTERELMIAKEYICYKGLEEKYAEKIENLEKTIFYPNDSDTRKEDLGATNGNSDEINDPTLEEIWDPKNYYWHKGLFWKTRVGKTKTKFETTHTMTEENVILEKYIQGKNKGSNIYRVQKETYEREY